MLALLIDWGYRADGIPVRLFGAWTTLPAGPATLAAKTGATIVPVAIRRTAGRSLPPRRSRARSRCHRRRTCRHRPGDPGDRRRAPGRRSPRRRTSGTASSRCGRRRAEEARRARGARPPGCSARESGRRWGPIRSWRRRRSRAGDAVDADAAPRRLERDRRPARPRRGDPRRLVARLPRPGGRRRCRRGPGRRDLVPVAPRARGAGSPQPRAGSPRELAATRPRLRPRAGRRHATREPWSGSSGSRSATTPATTSTSLRVPSLTPGDLRRARRDRDARGGRCRVLRRPGDLRRLHLGADRAAGALPGSPHAARTSWRPMETVDDPALQAWFERTRGARGHPDRRAARGARELARGARARRARGPRRRPRRHRRRHRRCRSSAPRRRSRRSGAARRSRPARPIARRRPAPAGDGRYRGRLELVPVAGRGHPSRADRGATPRPTPPPSSDLIAHAPEQWWAAFFPIWPDLARRRRAPAPPAAPADAPRRGARRRDRPARPAPTCTSTPSRPTARRRSRRSSTTSSARPTWTSSRSPTTSGSTPRSPPGRWPGTAGSGSRSIVGEEVTTLGGHLLALCIEEPVRPLQVAARDDRRDPRPGRARDPGPSARALPAVRPGLGPAAAARRPRSALPARRDRGVQPDDARPAVARPRSSGSPRSTACPPSATATPTRSTRSGPAGRRSRAATADDLRAAIAAGATHQHGTFHATGGQVGTFGEQLRKYGRDARAELGGRVRRDGTGRDLGYPGGPTGRRASTRRGAVNARGDGRRRSAMKIGLVTPYVYPLPGRRDPARPATCTRTSGCAATTSGSSPAATASSAPREGDVIRIGKGFSMPANGSVGTITVSPRFLVPGPRRARARAVRPPPLPRAVRAVPVARRAAPVARA